MGQSSVADLLNEARETAAPESTLAGKRAIVDAPMVIRTSGGDPARTRAHLLRLCNACDSMLVTASTCALFCYAQMCVCHASQSNLRPAAEKKGAGFDQS